MDFLPLSWRPGGSENEKNGYRINISFISPLRLKYRGKYLSDITFDDFVSSSNRRIKLLTGFYGKNNGILLEDLNYSAMVKSASLKWVDYNYYSARQKERLKLGGIIGGMVVEGDFDKNTLSILEAAELFHIGKNPSFGLGRVRVEKELI